MQPSFPPPRFWPALDVCFNSGLETMHQVEGRERGEAEVGGVHREGCFRQAFAPGTAELIDEDAEGSAQLLHGKYTLTHINYDITHGHLEVWTQSANTADANSDSRDDKARKAKEDT